MQSVTGEILFFCNGMKDILEAIEKLNTILPEGNIALPFYSELNQNYQNIITSIGRKISSIKTKRSNVHTEWGKNFIEDNSVPDGIYKRAIIIATNVAEASITIDTLKYVVDNGFAKVNTFKKELGITTLEIQEISEASRLQRKGRVGRVGDGIVHYVYKKDAKKNIKPKYKITQEDFSNQFLKLLATKEYKNLNEEKYKNNLSDLPIEYQNLSKNNLINITDMINYDKLLVSEKYNPTLEKFITNPIKVNDDYF